MFRLSYRDLQWDPILLRPDRYTIKNGVQTQWGSSGLQKNFVCVQQERYIASIGMPSGQGKISDAGYDQMACLVTKIPIYDHVRFRGNIRILNYPSPEEQNGQEGMGLFLRDTMTVDPRNGYPYSNMAAAGLFHGKPSVFGRDGITRDDIEHNRFFSRSEESAVSQSFIGKKLTVILEKHGSRLTSEIIAEGEMPVSEYEITVNEEIFSSRDPKMMYLGFLAARGCRMEVDLDNISVQYCNDMAVVDPVPILYASPGGNSLGLGTSEVPLDLQTAIDRCQNGQQIRVMPGRYQMTEDLIISMHNSGNSHGRKKITAENSSGEWVILDFGGCKHGFRIEGNYWDISGLTVTRGLGFKIQGSHNRIHHCHAIANLETGFLIRHPSIESPKKLWPSFNEIMDCVSCLNRDKSEQNADGFACKIAAGFGNKFVRCTAWMNSDDGFDLFCKNRSIGAVKLEKCRSWLNGYTLQNGKMRTTGGNGNGFKLGGSGLAVDHEAVNCEAIGNRGFGFTGNSNPYMRLISCDAGNNRENFVYYFTGPETQVKYISENCSECNDLSFDPSVWWKEHILPEFADRITFSTADNSVNLLQRYSITNHNENVIRNAIKEAAAIIGEENTDRPGILIMCSSLYGGGAERVACHLASGLTDRYRVIMLCIEDKGQTYPLDPEIKILLMPFFNGTWEMINESRSEYTKQIQKLLDIQVSISFMYTMNKVNAGTRGYSKVICSERNNPLMRYPERMQEIEKMYTAADHVVFQTETVRNMFSHNVQDHSSIILNPVEISSERTESRHRIINMARLVPQKNHAMLIRAFAAFYQDHPEYTLSIYGDGELSAELQKLTESLV